VTRVFGACPGEPETPRTPGGEGLADVRVVDAIERSVVSGKVEKVV
jgi:hypothetical protein